MKIPDEAVDAAELAVVEAMIEHGPDRHTDGYYEITRAAIEAAAPIMLSHELEQTRLAHLDAVVNAHTATRLQYAIDAVLAYGEDRKKATHEGGKEADAAVKSYAYHVKRIINEALES